MKTLGLVGGTGWVSTIDYYRLINQEINSRLGGHQFARCVIYSINFGDIIEHNQRNDTEGIFKMVKDATNSIITAGAQGIVLCANTLHKFADRLNSEIDKPIIHIAEATAEEINNYKMKKVGLLGTQYTMEEDFYTSKLLSAGIEPIVPELEDRKAINHIIYNEIIKEIFLPESKAKFLEIMDRLIKEDVEGIILGCTEIPLIIGQEDSIIPLFNTTSIHSKAAVDFALKDV